MAERGPGARRAPRSSTFLAASTVDDRPRNPICHRMESTTRHPVVHRIVPNPQSKQLPPSTTHAVLRQQQLFCPPLLVTAGILDTSAPLRSLEGLVRSLDDVVEQPQLSLSPPATRSIITHQDRPFTASTVRPCCDPPELVNSSSHRRATEPSEAAVLDAAERHLRLVPDRLVVDVDDPRHRSARQREPAVGVLRDDPRRQAVRGRVRTVDRVLGAADDLDRRAPGRTSRAVRTRSPSGTSVSRVAWKHGALRLAAREHLGALGDRVRDPVFDQSGARSR